MANERYSLSVDSPNARQRMDELQRTLAAPLEAPMVGAEDPAVTAFNINAFGPDTFPAPAPEAKGGVTSRAIKRGYYNTKASLAEMIGDLLEIKSFQDAAEEAAREAAEFAPVVPSFAEASGVGEFLLHGYETIVEQAPMLATLFVGGGGVGLGARALGAGANLAKGLGTAGGFATDVGILGGEAGRTLREAGVDPTTQKTGIAITGVANAALDFIPFVAIAGRMGIGPLAERLIVDEGIKRGLWKKLGSGALIGMVTEVPTETTQEINNMALRNIAQNKDALNLTDEDIAQLHEVMIGSAFAGGAMGGVGGIFEGKRKKASSGEPGVEPGGEVPPPPAGTGGGAVPGVGQAPTDEDVAPFFPDEARQTAANLAESAYILTPEGKQVVDEESDIPPIDKAAVDQQAEGEAAPVDDKVIRAVGDEQRRIAQMVFSAQKTLQNDPITRRLFQARQAVVEQSAQEDGSLSKEGKAKVEAIDQKIDEIAVAKGIENPKLDLLNDREMERYQYLMEKEAIEGLTDKEYSTLEKLIAKAQGERQAARVKASPELEAALEAEIEAAPDTALYSTQFRRPTNGMTKEALEAALASVRMGGEGKVQIYNNPLELPLERKELRDSVMKGLARGWVTEGSYHPDHGTVLFAEYITPERAVPVYMHEVLAHHGLRAVLNPEEMQALVRAAMLSNVDVIKNYIEKRGLSPSKENVERAAEEYIAKIAESGTDMSLLRKVIAIIMRALRRLFGKLADGITDDEIRLWLSDMRKDMSGQEIDNSLPGLVAAANYLSLSEIEGSPDDLVKAMNGYTMRIMDKLEKRDWITPGMVRTALKKSSPNKVEMEVVKEVLGLPGFGEKFLRKDFEMELMRRVSPLTMAIDEEYGQYGLENIIVPLPRHGRPDLVNEIDQSLRGLGMGMDFIVAESHIWRFPNNITTWSGEGRRYSLYDGVQKGFELNHFDDDQYAGHVRVMYRGDHDIADQSMYITEVQSDLYQKFHEVIEDGVYELLSPEAKQDLIRRTQQARMLQNRYFDSTADSVPPVLEGITQLVENDSTLERAVEQVSDTVVTNQTPGWNNLIAVMQQHLALIESKERVEKLTEYIDKMKSHGEHVISYSGYYRLLQAIKMELRIATREMQAKIAVDSVKVNMKRWGWEKHFLKEIRNLKHIFRRLIREEVQNAADLHYFGGAVNIPTIRVAMPITLANIESHIFPKERIRTWKGFLNRLVIDNEAKRVLANRAGELFEPADTNPKSLSSWMIAKKIKVAPIYQRHEELLKWIKNTYDGRVVTDSYGFEWMEFDVKPEYAGKKIAFASDASREALNLLSDFQIDDQRLPDSLDKFNRLWGVKTLRKLLTPLQMSKIFKLEPSTRYVNFVDRYAATKGDVIAPAQEVVDRWTRLGSDEAQRLSSALFETTIESDELNRRLTPEEEQAILSKHKVEGDLLDLYADIGLYFKQLSERLEAGLKYNAIRETLDTKQKGVDNSQTADEIYERWEKTRDDPAARSQMLMELFETPQVSLNLNARLVNIEADFEKLRNRNYFPYMRFGQYVITVRAGKDAILHKGKEYKKGQVVQFWTFEDKESQEAFFKDPEMTAMRQRGFDVAMSLMEDRQFAFLAMPPSLINTIDERLGLNNAQREELKELFIERSPGRAFLRHLLKRKGIDGFSQDAMRVFATYAMNAANHIARVENYVDMDKALSDLKEMKYDFEARQNDSRGLMELYNTYNQHFNYLMNPGNDLAKYRAMGFMFFLGFNVKSAAVNLTQIPMVVYPVLATKYGDVAAVSEIAKGMKTAMDFFRGKGVDPVLDKLIAQGIREGFLDESQATELAGVGEASVLQRVLPSEKSHRLINQFTLYGTYLFKQAEKFTRLAAFSAVVRLELARGATVDQAYTEAKEAVRLSLFEYAKWNRPEFMRGKKSVFFLFWTYMQHLSFLAFGGAGQATAMRIWIMMLLMAGIQGLPFMENILDILDFGLTKVKQATGMKNPYTDLRTDIRKLLLEFTDTPDLIMHGMGRYYGLGPLHLLELAGIPVPRVDVSGSLSMGRVIPGLDQMLGPERNVDEKFGRTVVELMGPVFAMPYMLYRAANDSDPDSWKRWERAMPVALKSASKASRWMVRGEEEFRGGGTIAEFNPLDAQHHAEIAAQSLGFAPTRVQQRYERRAAIETAKEYWLVRRQLLLEDYAYVKLIRHREGMADIRSAIREYNSTVPHWKLKIDQETLTKSIESRKKSIQARQKDVPTAKRFVPLSREYASAYPEAQP